jgi:hypothetical protein
MNLPEMNPPELQFLRRLRDAGVSFVIVGGHAVVVHGYRRTTEDLDLVWLRTPESEPRLLEVLSSINARWISNEIDPTTRLERLVPVSLPYVRTEHLMMLVTDVGFLDAFDNVPGCPDVRVSELFADGIEIDGLRFTSLAWLRRMKEAAGRLKDQLDLQELDRLYELP